MYDVICFGALCADLKLRLPYVPRPGEGVHVRRATWAPGGNALIEARTLAAWGVRVWLGGDSLGADAAGAILADEVDRLGLGTHVVRDPAVQTPICHILITPDGERTILAIRGAAPPAHLPAPAELAGARLVSVTRYGPHTLTMAEAAQAAGRPVLAGDALLPDDPLAAYADAIVTSTDMLRRQRPTLTIEEQMVELHRRRGAAVIVSDGPRPARMIWRSGAELCSATVEPPTTAVADSTGAGDMLRAGVAYGMLQGWPWPRTLAFACTEASRALRDAPDS